MKDEELIAQAREIGPALRASTDLGIQRAGWVLKEIADRLEQVTASGDDQPR